MILDDIHVDELQQEVVDLESSLEHTNRELEYAEGEYRKRLEISLFIEGQSLKFINDSLEAGEIKF